MAGCLGFRNRAQSAGLRVRALNPLITVEMAIVRANCLYNWPVMPPIKAVGINTANSTSTIPTTAPDTSFMAWITASFTVGYRPVSISR